MKTRIRIFTSALLFFLIVGCTAQPVKTSDPTAAPSMSAAPTPENEQPSREPVQKDEYRFTVDTFPTLDGSTSLVPLGEALMCELLGISRSEAEETIRFHRTNNSFYNLRDHSAKLLLVSEPEPALIRENETRGFKFEMKEICTEALTFLVNANNPVDQLTTEQIRKIYTGEITNWSEVGGLDIEIVPFQRNATSGSQVLMEKLVMQGEKMSEPIEDLIETEMSGLINHVREYDNSANALGYSVYYYVHNMEMAKGLKLLRVDGVLPSEETIRSGAYPHLNPYFCVINADAGEKSPERILFDWLSTEDGRRVIAREGYVPTADSPLEMDLTVFTDDSNYAPYTPYVTSDGVYTRLSPGPLDTFIPSDDYGSVYPYIQAPIRGSNYMDDSEVTYGYRYGLIDANGRILTDGIYSEIKLLEREDVDFQKNGGAEYVPLWLVSSYDGTIDYENNDEEYSWYEPKLDYGVVSLDGSFALPVQYERIEGYEDCIVCFTRYHHTSEAHPFDYEVYDLSGKLLFTGSNIDSPSAAFPKHGDGMFVLQDYHGQHLEQRFVDLHGNPMLTSKSFYRIAPFHDGLACVTVDNRGYGYIDTAGNWVIRQKYLNDSDFHNGVAIQENESRTKLLIDRNGTVLAKLDESSGLSFREAACGFKASGVYGNSGISTNRELFYDHNGKLLLETERIGSREWDALDDNIIWLRDMNSKEIVLKSLRDPDKELRVKGELVLLSAALVDGVLQHGYEVFDSYAALYNEIPIFHHSFVTEDLTSVIPLSETTYQSALDYAFDHEFPYLHDKMTGKIVYRVESGDRYLYYDSDDRLIGSCAQNVSSEVIGGLIRVVDGNSCSYYRSDGSVLFSYPIRPLAGG